MGSNKHVIKLLTSFTVYCRRLHAKVILKVVFSAENNNSGNQPSILSKITILSWWLNNTVRSCSDYSRSLENLVISLMPFALVMVPLLISEVLMMSLLFRLHRVPEQVL